MNGDMPKIDVLSVLASLNGNTSSLKLDAQVEQVRDVVADLISGARMLIEAQSPKQCFQSRRQTQAYATIRSALARIGGES